MSEFVKDVSDSSFETEVLGAGKPVLVDFWAEWCAPCRMLAPTVDGCRRALWRISKRREVERGRQSFDSTALRHQGNSDFDPFPRRQGSRARGWRHEQRVDYEDDREVRCREGEGLTFKISDVRRLGVRVRPFSFMCFVPLVAKMIAHVWNKRSLHVSSSASLAPPERSSVFASCRCCTGRGSKHISSSASGRRARSRMKPHTR